ncbi:phosphoglycerate kinase [Microbacteriaceae bacterium]|nr:phosphoglycerate kinase [Candidatus Saccharibacteria bacterium]
MKKSGGFFKKSMIDMPLRGKTILLRADYNVPLTKDGKVADDFRIRSNLPTVKKLLEHGCKVVIISHLGRPDGQKNLAFTLEPAAARLAKLLGENVRFVDDCIGHKAKMAIKRAPMRSVIVLENLRFYPGEEANDVDFGRQLAETSGAAYFVQDGFGVVHRAHASTSAITQFLPSAAGLLLEREYVTITSAMKNPTRPLLAVMGGAKVSDKIGVIKAFVGVADTIAIGGAMANTFLADNNIKLGKSKVEENQHETIAGIYAAVDEKVGSDHRSDFLVLPKDLAVGASLEQTATMRIASLNGVNEDEMALDIGPETVNAFVELVRQSKTVIWNGNLGMTEIPAFRSGSEAFARALSEQSKTTSIIGGGDTADFVIHWDKKHGESFSHVSTGGGASLELMSGMKLPGIESLLDARW